MGTSYDVVQIVDVVFLHDAGQILDDAAAGEGVDKVGSAYLDRRCAREHQLDDVLGTHHAAETDDGDAHCFVDLPDNAHGERLEFIFVKNILRSVEAENGDGRFARRKKTLGKAKERCGADATARKELGYGGSYRFTKALEQCGRLSRPALEGSLEILADADARMKQSAADGRTVLEVTILRLIELLRRERA